MIDRPDHYVRALVDFSSSISVHVEAEHDVAKNVERHPLRGCKAGLAISPPTAIERIEPFLGLFDILLVMTVNPGFGGQAFITGMMEKVRQGAAWRAERGLDYHIEVDGASTRKRRRPPPGPAPISWSPATSVFRAPDMAVEIASLR